jgi:hypothetical protein
VVSRVGVACVALVITQPTLVGCCDMWAEPKFSESPPSGRLAHQLEREINESLSAWGRF